MSHLPERKEKICLNCNTSLEGRFCHVCGQENIEPREGFWHMLTHFVFDLFHFDGKFLSTLKYLLCKPGYLSKEHLMGRRASYLHPIRMYVFTSAFFFLIFFSFFQKGEKKFVGPHRAVKVEKELKNNKKGILRALKMASVISDSTIVDSLQQKLKAIDADINLLKKDTANVAKLHTFDIRNADNNYITFDDNDIQLTTLQGYDSIQKSLPDAKRDGFFTKTWKRQIIELKENHHNNSGEIGKAIADKLIHLFPQFMFSSLPLVSLVLLMLYIRRKRFYYADHLVFSIHLICAYFIFILFGLIIDSVYNAIFGDGIPYFLTIMFFLLSYYLFKAIRNFYEQSISKTIFKFLALLIMNLILVAPLLFIFFIIISLFTAH